MTVTDVNIVNRAYARLGVPVITSFADDNDRARLANQIYAGFRDGILADYPWSFATKKKKLTLSGSTPVSEWDYLHNRPSDMLGSTPWAIFHTDAAGAEPYTYFEVFEDGIYANVNELWADYAFSADESVWPWNFQRFMTAAFAAECCMALTDNTDLQVFWDGKAYGSPEEDGRGGLWAAAATHDAQTKGPQGIESSELIAHRFG